jgi:hypothetical protein
MRNALLVARNALRVTFRGRSRILVYFVMPVLGVVLSFFLTFARNGTVHLGVVDMDQGRFSRALVQAVADWGHAAPAVMTRPELSRRIEAGSLDAGVVIPAGWSDSLLADTPLAVQLV